jgi:hypothetical protein
MPRYVDERRQPHDYEERRLSRHDEDERRLLRHDEEVHHPRFVEERRLGYAYEERRPPHHVEEIRRAQFVQEVHAPTHLPESQYAPPTYYRHIAPPNDLYHPHQANMIYER